MSNLNEIGHARPRHSRLLDGAGRPALALLLALVLPACQDSPTDPDGGDAAGETAFYVDAARGADANPGTREAPFGTLATAIQRAGPGQEIRVAGGVYPQALSLRSGVRVMGGYDGASWRRTSSPTFVGSGGVAVTGRNVSDVILDGLVMQSGDVSDPGASSIALLLENVTGVVVRSSRVLAGRGADGRAGANGAPGGNGGAGAAGQLPVACFPGVTRSGGDGANSSFAAGGRGGFGSTVDGGDGVRGGGADGGDGGPGGRRIGGGGQNGREGRIGAAGARGQDGRGGEEFGALADGVYQTAAGANATAGGNGSGGGGGGGGAGAAAACGASGGGGGGGGARGAIGTGGTGGGGSFGVVVSGSVTLEGVEIVTAGGGNGGAGGRGGAGGNGGAGGAGRSGSGVLGASGKGGVGGKGGEAGHGGGGGGGPSIGILETAGAQVTATGVTFTLGSGGTGGTSPGNPGLPGARAERRTNQP
jgi:hypothetical protein